MTSAEPSDEGTDSNKGEVRLAEPSQKVDFAAEARTDSWLFVEVSSPGPAMRGRLALLIESAIEDALERRAAAPPGVGASSNLDASLSDQLYRARQVGARGLAIAIGSLEGIANLSGALDAEDSAVLRWWFAAAAERPLRVAMDARDRYLGVYAAPTTLGALLEAGGQNATLIARLPGNSRVPDPAPELASSVRTMDLSASPPAPKENDDPAPAIEVEAQSADAEAHSDVVEAQSTNVEAQSADVPARALDAAARGEWRAWVRELDFAKGPKPLATIERMFVSAYMPLSDAVERGIADAKAEIALRSWAASFERSYTDAFDALKLRGKRPLMVLDLPDSAYRIARLHGARSVQLVLVDGMRFDLGLRIQDRLRPLLGQRAALTERLLTWAALPTTTAVQLELIGRGPDGLREACLGADTEVPVARGRNALTMRRVKTGQRELMKLDVVEARLAEPGGPAPERLDAIAGEAAEALANHFLRLAPRTLVMVFGDHGFVLDALDGGTSAARQGGATPEEVLVPAFAWLVGDVH